jgi:hypothetical protein
MRRQASALALVLWGACATSRLEPRLQSSADSVAYALRYPDALAAAQRAFDQDAQQAQQLSVALSKRIHELKADDSALLLRVVNEADAAGRSEEYARTRRQDRELADFWSEERGGLASRASAAAQKELAETSCADKDLAPAVQHALKDGLDRPREKRLRASNEAHHTLELHRTRLAGSLAGWQRAADEIALASHYTHVALREDMRELERLLGERNAVEATLGRAVDDERVIQSDPRAGEQKASQDRVVRVEKVRASLAAVSEPAQRALDDQQRKQAEAERAYEQAIEAIREHLRAVSPAQPQSGGPDARAVKH